MGDFEKDLHSVYDEVVKRRLSFNELNDISPLRKLLEIASHEPEPEGWIRRNTLQNIAFVLTIFTCLVVLYHPFKDAMSLILNKMDFAKGDCLVKAPHKFAEWFRPPVDCNVCQKISAVDIVQEISVEEFTAKYAYSSVPLVVRGAASNNWATAGSNIFTFDFFRQVYLNSYPGSLDVLEEHCQFFPYRTEFSSLREVLNMSAERFNQTWYVGWSNCDISVATLLRTLYSRPTFLPAGSQSGRFDWVFMGTPGYGAHMHVDNVGKPSWQAQLIGNKLWTLEPPRECYFQCQTMQVTVHPGDIIFLDTDLWYHSTLITGNDISVTIGSEYD